ncbi:MAG TPA: hypothetical protein DCG58_07745 [Hyphomonas adhaerens]|uniref:Uncharacterized protein n=1 Tax=Hyphomonas adhaerens TaxID=81029 RepID=A0A3B9GXU5_9PROT|nr:hypothetical protein [Hyphomonas sp.]HAE27036.1 hypothetical protein [Hyphomonas adhaerens]
MAPYVEVSYLKAYDETVNFQRAAIGNDDDTVTMIGPRTMF